MIDERLQLRLGFEVHLFLKLPFCVAIGLRNEVHLGTTVRIRNAFGIGENKPNFAFDYTLGLVLLGILQSCV